MITITFFCPAFFVLLISWLNTIAGVNLGRHPKSPRFDDDEHEERSSLHYHLPVPPSTFPDISSFVANRQGHWSRH